MWEKHVLRDVFGKEKGDSRHLYSVFRELSFHGQHFPGIHIRVVGLTEGLLQLFQLVGSENSPVGRPKAHIWVHVRRRWPGFPDVEDPVPAFLHPKRPHHGNWISHLWIFSLWKVQKFDSNKTEFFNIVFLLDDFYQLILRRSILKVHKIVSLKCYKDYPTASCE